MKSLFLSIKSLFPYLLLILIYFFFINIEARNGRNNYEKNNVFSKQEKDLTDHKAVITDNNTRISIPVIPFNE